MGLIATLVGLGVGFLANVGRSAQSAQAAAMVAEAGAICENRSAGTARATLEVRQETRDGVDRVVLVTGVQRAVLTANFEAARKGQPDTEWIVSAGGTLDVAQANGDVRVVEDGHAGRAAAFAKSGFLDFGRRPSFAVTNGLEVDLMVAPEPGRTRMTLLRADDGSDLVWMLSLSKTVTTGPEAYQVEVSTRTVSEKSDTGVAAIERVATRENVVPAGAWSHLRVTHDGRRLTVTVNGVARALDLPPVPKTAPPPEPRRFLVPASGVARLTASASQAPFAGRMDSLQVSGIFRAEDDVRELANVRVLARRLPLVLHFTNGRLDPSLHAQDEYVRVQALAEADSGVHWRVRFSPYAQVQPPERVVEEVR
jgi:hypothetical protein